MAKNMTRKSLALGAAFALVGSALVAAPAQAANEVTLAPSTGTSYGMISGETLTLQATAGSTIASSAYGTLKYSVANASGLTVSTTFTQAGNSVTDNDLSSNTATSAVVKSTGGTITGSTSTLAVSVPATEAGNVVVTAWLDADGDDTIDGTEFASEARTITFTKPANVATTVAITAPTAGDTAISAKLSFNNINNEQLAQGDVGVYFTKGDGSTLYPTASVTATSLTSNVATFTAANNFVNGQTVTIAGHTNTVYNVTGTVANASATSFTLAITNADIASATGLTGVTATSATANSVKSNVAWSATNQFSYTTSAITALVKDGAVKVQPLYKATGTPASTDTIGTAVTAVVAERKAATIVGDVVASTTAKVTTAGSAGQTLLNSSFQAKVVVKDGATTPVGVAGAAVTATVTSTGLSAVAGSEKTLSVNGTTYSNSSLLPGQGSVAKLALTTNASGEAVINFTTAGYSANDTITVVFYTENLTSATLTLTQVAASYTATVRPFFTTTDGAVVSVPVVVYDQFGGVPADKYDVRATFDATNANYVAQATAASTSGSSTIAALVGGKATLSITDNGTGLGVNSYDITVQERLAGNNYGSTITTLAVVDVHVLAAASLVAATVTSNGTQNATTKVYEIAGPVALSLVTPKAYDSVTVLGAAPSSYTSKLIAQNITGTVSTVANATTAATAVPGAQVTLSGAGLMFNDNGTGLYTVDSITVTANTSGVYSVNVYSNKAGKQTVAITSGAATATTTVVFAPAKDDTGTTLVISAPDSVVPGSTLAITVTLTDTYGNKVTTDSTALNFNDGTTAPTFSLSSDSPGFQIGTNPTVTDKDGLAKLAYFLGVNDSGAINVTATYDADGAGTAKSAVTVTKTIFIGFNTGAPSTWTKNLKDGTAKMYAKNIIGSGKVQFMLNGKEVAWIDATSERDAKLRIANGASYLVRTVDLKAGKNVLEIYIDGYRMKRAVYSNK